jgi:hypothetical protein
MYVGQNMFFNLLVDGWHVYDLNSSKLPATAVTFENYYEYSE